MTNLQMQYTDLLEKMRHNKATEEVATGELEEKVRHNVKSESLEQANQALTKAIQESKNRIDIFKIQNDREVANVKNALEQYKLDIEKWAKENGLRIDAAKADAAIAKTTAEIDKIIADTQETYADTELSKAKKREINVKLNGSVSGLLGQIKEDAETWLETPDGKLYKQGVAAAREVLKTPLDKAAYAKDLVTKSPEEATKNALQRYARKNASKDAKKIGQDGYAGRPTGKFYY